jgi:hypothetical protein
MSQLCKFYKRQSNLLGSIFLFTAALNILRPNLLKKK